jgi:putative Holliday junction resolvase
MPEAGAGATPVQGRVGIPSAPAHRLAGAAAGPVTEPAADSVTDRIALGFDFGTRRIGVAVGGTASAAAQPLCVLAADAALWGRIAALVDQWQPQALGVGIPRHPDGRPNAMTARCERFARQLQGRFGRAVARVDERYSSAVVGGAAARDDEAAAVILRQWLDEGSGA